MSRGRQEAKEFWSDYLYKDYYADEKIKSFLKQAIDSGYCEGYNTVLDAIAEVLPKESYWKVVNYLDSIGK